MRDDLVIPDDLQIGSRVYRVFTYAGGRPMLCYANYIGDGSAPGFVRFRNTLTGAEWDEPAVIARMQWSLTMHGAIVSEVARLMKGVRGVKMRLSSASLALLIRRCVALGTMISDISEKRTKS